MDNTNRWPYGAYQVKGSSGRGLEYFQFVELLFYVACMRYHSIDASVVQNAPLGVDNKRPASPTSAGQVLSGAALKKELASAKRLDNIAQQSATVAAERFGRYAGKQALIARIAFE